MITSCIMALVLVVTVVSVSAAWFGDTRSITNEIDVNSARPEGQIVIDTSLVNSSGNSIVPAIMNKGRMLLYDDSELISEYFGELKDQTKAKYFAEKSKDDSLTYKSYLENKYSGEDKPFLSVANTAVIYFPVFGIGQIVGGKLPVQVEISGVYLMTEPLEAKKYLDEFIIDMEVVEPVWEGESDEARIVGYNDKPSSNGSSFGETYWGYSAKDYKLGIIMDHNTNCFIKLSISFAQVDEDLPPELLDNKIRIDISIPSGFPDKDKVLDVIKEDPRNKLV